METEITMFYVVCDNMLKTMSFRDDCQTGMSTAEVMTVVLTAARFFCGSIRTSAVSLSEHGYIPKMLSEGRLSRRTHATDESAWENLFLTFAEIFRGTGNTSLTASPFRYVSASAFPGRKFSGGRTGADTDLPSDGILTEHGSA